MSTRTPLALTLCLSLLLVAACDEQPVQPEVTAAAAVPLDNFLNGPATPGPHLVRGQGTFAATWIDPKRGVRAVVGVDIVDFCTGPADFDIVAVQEGMPPGDATRIMQLVQGGEMAGSAWDFLPFDCGLFTTEDPLAAGTVGLVNTDNDLLVFLDPDNRNANAFGFRVHGAFSGHSNCRWDGNDFATIKCTDVIIAK